MRFNPKVTVVTSLVVSLAAIGTASAGGFLLNDHGAKATGRMDAVTATVTDGSAVFYNPGGIGAAEGTHIYLGASLIMPSASFTEDRTGETTDTESNLAVTPTAYFHTETHKMVRVGIGFHTPFGSTLEWPEASPGRDVLRKTKLRTFFITPSVGLNLGKWVPGLSIGGGIDIVPADILIERDIVFGDTIGTAELGGDAIGFGGRAGVQYRPPAVKGLAVGVAYRSEVQLDFEGNSNFDIAEPFRASLPPDGDISAGITLPQSVLAGIAYKVADMLEFEFDVHWVDWSSVDQIDIKLADESVIVDRRDYEAVATLRFGVEYNLKNLGLDIRAGYGYDPTPIPTNRLTVGLPDVNRHVVSAGASYKLPKGYVDFGILSVLPGELQTSDTPNEPQLKGKMEISALVFALSYGINFGGEPDPAAAGALVTAKK